MSLAFLAKKSWHTSNLRNVEKVWLAEQKVAAEEKKLAELKKNYEEERQLQELRKLQAAHGNKSAAVERLDWMYQGPMASSSSEKTAEEYLLGKEYKPEEPGSDDRKLGDTAYGALALNKSALPANDAFSRLNEDPMMLIRSQQKRAHEEVLKNPVKMKKIKGQVEQMLKEKKEKKKAKKQAKKERKLAKREKRRDRSASVASDDDPRAPAPAARREERHRPRSCDRDTRPNRDRRSRSPERASRRSRRSPSPSRSRSRDRRRRSSSLDRDRGRTHRRSANADRISTQRRDRSRSQDSFGRTVSKRSPSPRIRHRDLRDERRSPDRYRHTRKRSTSPRRRSQSPEHRHGRDRDRSRPRHDQDREADRKPASAIGSHRDRSRGRRRRSLSADRDRDARRGKSPAHREYAVSRPDDGGKYGLIHKDGAIESKDIDRTTLGPSTKFLEQAREKKRHEAEELRRKLGKGPRESTSFSHEEMLKQAAQMAENAKAREAFLAKRAAEKREKLDEDEAKLRDDDPQFLKQLQDAVYTKGDASMKDRLRRNAHYVQRRAEASNFLAKD